MGPGKVPSAAGGGGEGGKLGMGKAGKEGSTPWRCLLCACKGVSNDSGVCGTWVRRSAPESGSLLMGTTIPFGGVLSAAARVAAGTGAGLGGAGSAAAGEAAGAGGTPWDDWAAAAAGAGGTPWSNCSAARWAATVLNQMQCDM